MIQITANGDSFQIKPNTSLIDFLKSLELQPEQVVVERNRQALTQGECAQAKLADGDSLEIVRIVAGG